MDQSNLEEIRRIFYAAPFITDLGLSLESVDAGKCVTTLQIKPGHLQQDGFVHAGVQATMADHTAGTAAGSLLQPGQIVLTAEFKINFLRPAKGNRLVCKAQVIKPGRKLSVVESAVYCTADEEEKLVSKLMGSIAVVSA